MIFNLFLNNIKKMFSDNNYYKPSIFVYEKERYRKGIYYLNVYGEIVLYKNDKIHREDDEPAIITNSNKIWMKNVKRHREYDKPGVVGNDGFKAWCVNGKYHREM